MKMTTLFAAALAATAAAAPLAAQTDPKMAELERKVEALAGEVERLKLGEAAEPELTPLNGLGPAAAKVYQKTPKRVSVGGYGEMVYENFEAAKQDGTGSGKRDTMDFLRAVLYAGYKFNDWIAFNSELEFEHASQERRGSVGVEMAQLDFKPWGDALGFRAGLMLMPVGLVNEIHEPTAFNGVKRPNVERSIIPATWSENGAGVFGSYGPLSYRSYLVTGLQAASQSNVTGFDAADGLREGRSAGSKSFAQDLAWVGRVDLTPTPGTTLGGSLYVGEADQSHLSLPSVPVTLWELHGDARWRGAELKALFAQVRVGNADSLNAVQGNAVGGNASVGRRMYGGYVEAAFDVLTLAADPRGQSLTPFVRYERYDTQAAVPDAWTKSPANSRTEVTLGAGWKPTTQVVVKADHQFRRNLGRTGVGQTNVGIGYIF